MRKIVSILGIVLANMWLVTAQNSIDYAQPTTYEVGGIEVTGVQYTEESILINLTGITIGDKINIPGDEIPKATKALWDLGLFADVQIYASRIINDVIFLKIVLQERVRLSKYNFTGVKKGEEEDLREKLGLVRGRIINENLLSNIKNTVIAFYKDKGFLNIEVEMKQENDEQFTNSNALTVAVSRGEKVKIANILFKGNEHAVSRKLKKKMGDTKEKTGINRKAVKNVWQDLKSTRLSEALANISPSTLLNYIDENVFKFKLFSSSKFLEDKFEADKNAVIDYYNELGFRDARIVSDTIYDFDEKSINIEMTVEEGQRYYFRNIDWRGNSKYSDEILDQILAIKKGDIYNQSLLQTRLFLDPNSNDVTSLYMDDGYLFFQVTPVEKAIVGDSIDLVINVYEGPQATVNNIIITGNTKTSEHVIRRELRTLPGNKFSRSDIIRSQREIASLGMFDPEQIEINPIPNPQNGTVDIEYKVVEKPSDQLELSAGWGAGRVVGSIGVAFNNFSLRNITEKDAWKPLPSGDGQSLSFRFQSTGRAFQSINASFTEPWLGGKRPNSLTVSAFSSRQFSNSFVADLEDDQKQLLYITGVSASIGRRLKWPDDNFVMQNSVNYQRYNLRNWRTDFLISDGTSNNFSFTTSLSRYSIDAPIYPRRGSNISLSLQFTPPYSLFSNKDYAQLKADNDFENLYKWTEYHKWRFTAEWYTPLSKNGKLVLKTAVKFGFLGYYNSTIGHTPFERFEVGGDGISNFSLQGIDIISLRGYEENEITQNRVVGQNGQNTNVGDPYFAKYTVELRYPLSLNPSATIFGLAFAEGGNSWSNFKEFSPFDVRRSAGLGVRIFLPMFGLLGFDYGVGFDKFDAAGNPIAPSNGFRDFLSRHGRFSVILGFEPE